MTEILKRMPATQQELADRLGITQGHLSKIKSRKILPSERLRIRIENIYDCIPAVEIEPWLETIRVAAERSREAKLAMEAIARIIQKYA
ncbi:helix-turn-helix transcriptional regulator [Bradyrhizobium sp. ORS 285]|uniref:helix-turn-helix domain-containing protein n=1 Tax=Bradyrhizobium sp. ORS 285 TaxID=115808 RepID=UPI001111F0FE|nr:helix-turn-helix transcriptional regulator [Bradyrhizobium sp. ORS 285]